MSLTLAALIDGVRNLSPTFVRSRVPDRALGGFFTTYQRRLLDLAQQRDPQAVVARAHIILDATVDNLTENIGAGEDGAMPGDVLDGTPVVGTVAAGSLVELTVDDTVNNAVVILVADRVVNAATTTSIDATGAGWTTNQFANRYVVIKAGTGVGQRRKIVGNDSDTIFIDSDQAFDPAPDVDSTFDVVAPVTETSGQMGVVTQLPALDTRVAYTVSLDASGQAQINLVAPLAANFDASVPVAPFSHILGGTVRFINDPDYTEPLTILSYGNRHDATATPAIYTLGERVYLAGVALDWIDIATIELQYVPIPPAFTALTDVATLPDAAFPAFVAAGGEYAARRCNELGVSVDLGYYADRAREQEAQYLTSTAARRRGRVSVTREVW